MPAGVPNKVASLPPRIYRGRFLLVEYKSGQHKLAILLVPVFPGCHRATVTPVFLPAPKAMLRAGHPPGTHRGVRYPELFGHRLREARATRQFFVLVVPHCPAGCFPAACWSVTVDATLRRRLPALCSATCSEVVVKQPPSYCHPSFRIAKRWNISLAIGLVPAETGERSLAFATHIPEGRSIRYHPIPAAHPKIITLSSGCFQRRLPGIYRRPPSAGLGAPHGVG